MPYIRAWPGRFNALVLSQDPFAAEGLSKTLNEGAGEFSTSSNAVPEDFRRPKVFGILMGIEMYLGSGDRRVVKVVS